MPSIKRNLNILDRTLRSFVALACIYIGFIDTSYINDEILAGVVGVFGIINILAAAVGSCPIYSAAGVSTYRPKARQE